MLVVQIFEESRRIWGTIFFHMCVGASPQQPPHMTILAGSI